jgi:hypothetical protein
VRKSGTDRCNFAARGPYLMAKRHVRLARRFP